MTIMSVHDTDISALLTDLNLTSSQCIEYIFKSDLDSILINLNPIL